ncbi:MAG: hypothetical protein HBSAPP02_11200 [Phycisphaerae bacterium]|nr:MAG: HD domain-containing protein [Planctomycetia bacterium]RIK69149.1 MAG: hypothetical protein DCC66_09130 [Planctomycetota bacterium]GJQ26088.1 MAG: hypothetical protein HBSAPP02_11200 [Phycisphaerae bacterium]
MAEDPLLATLPCLIDALHCGALVVDRARRIVLANARLADLLGLTVRDLIGRDPRTLCKPLAEGSDHAADFDAAFEMELGLIRADGGVVPARVSGKLLGEQPPHSDFRLVTVIDLTAQKAAEERAREEYVQMSRMSDTVIEQALELKRYSAKLEDRVRQRTEQLREANMEAIYMLAVASEAKDQDTGSHVRRIEAYTRALALELGLTESTAEQYGYSAILHDVGKMQVPDHILKKPAPLTREERALIQEHTIAGERILSRKPFFEIARQIARSHHENWDGSGYPDGLKGDATPQAARIVHLADVYDALVSERVYKPAWTTEQALEAIRGASGKLFEPRTVDAFTRLVEKNRLPRSDASAKSNA